MIGLKRKGREVKRRDIEEIKKNLRFIVKEKIGKVESKFLRLIIVSPANFKRKRSGKILTKNNM